MKRRRSGKDQGRGACTEVEGGRGDEWSRRVQGLLQWMRENSVSMNEELLELDMEEGGRGLKVVARKAIKATQEKPRLIATVAKSACLSLKNVPAVETRLEEFGLATSGNCHDADTALAAAITHEMLLGSKSKWSAYLRSLPHQGEPVPLLWPEPLLELLQGTDVLDAVVRDRGLAADSWHQAVMPLLRDALGNNLMQDEEAAFDVFLRAISFGSSRGFFVDSEHGEALVPLADMFNHKIAFVPLGAEVEGGEDSGEEDDSQEGAEGKEHGRDDEWSLDEDEDTDVHERDRATREGREMEMALGNTEQGLNLPIVLMQEATAGSEIRNSYGEKGNADLLRFYGFVIEDNIFDSVIVTGLSRVAGECVGSRQVRARSRWLEGLARSVPGRRKNTARTSLDAGLVGFVVKGRHGSRCSRGALRFALVCGMSDDSWEQLQKKDLQSALAWLDSIDEKQVIECADAASMLQGALSHRLDQLPEKGVRLEADWDSGLKWFKEAFHMSRVVVEGERRLLQRAMARLKP